MMQDICVKKSTHLQYDDRQLIEKLYQLHHSQKEIAWVMHCSESKISRELKRGMVELRNGATWENYMTYSAQAAQADADLKKTAKGAPLKIGHDYKLAKHIENKILKEHYSPYAIVKEIQDDGLHFETTLSISTIYNYVGSAVFLHVKPRHLLRMKKHKKESPQRQAYANILKPCITARDVTRDVFGHWEMDTVIGQAKGKNNVLLVLTERKTRYEIIMKIASKNAESVVNALGKLKRRYRKRFRKVFLSITVDNGCEFSDYDSMKAFTPIYYCHPYSSWERGSNENANSIIRRWIPKGVDMNKVTVKQVQFVENWINNYPRKVIGTTSQKAFNTELEQLQ